MTPGLGATSRRTPGATSVTIPGPMPAHAASAIFGIPRQHDAETVAVLDDSRLDGRRVLQDDGVLRLSTPNLDWVWFTHYRLEMSETEQTLACFAINRAFRGWGHQFLYNERTLRSTLLDAGFGKAWWTIVDTHVTTIVSCAFLFMFGTGPVRGFAITLVIGLFANVFTAVFVSKVIFDFELSRRRQVTALSI